MRISHLSLLFLFAVAIGLTSLHYRDRAAKDDSSVGHCGHEPQPEEHLLEAAPLLHAVRQDPTDSVAAERFVDYLSSSLEKLDLEIRGRERRGYETYRHREVRDQLATMLLDHSRRANF